MTVHNPKMFIFFLFNNKLPSSSLVLCGLPVMGRPTQNLRGELLQYNTAFSEEFLQVFQEGITFLHFDNFMYPIGQQTQGILHLPLTRGGPTHTQEAHRLEWRESAIRMSQLQKGHLGIFTNPPYSAAWLMTVGMLVEVPKPEGKTKRKCFLLTWAFFQFPALQLTKDHTITSLEPQSLCHCLGLAPGKWDHSPQMVIVAWFPVFWNHLPLLKALRTFLTGFFPSFGQTPDCSQHMQGFCPQQLQPSHIPHHSNVVKTIPEWVILNNFTKYCVTKINCF